MTLLYRDPLFRNHQTGAHPERPARLEWIDRMLEDTGLANRCVQPAPCEATDEQLCRVHTQQYVDQLRRYAANGGGRVEVDTVMSARSNDVARIAAGTACDAVARVLAGEDRNALCLVRPPGHHALVDSPMGFCLLNNIAIAAHAALQQHGLDRVLIVDWDVHHGNGTQDAFWSNERVGFLSIHRYPFYPGTGGADETGSGAGLSFTCNLPMLANVTQKHYHQAFTSALEKLADKLRPQLVLISAGFDAHRLDPIGSLGLDVEDFAELTDTVAAVAQHHCHGKMVSLLEGGYNLEVLAQCVDAHLTRLLDHSDSSATSPAER